VENLVEDADDELFRRVLYNENHVLHPLLGYLTETNMVMNWDADATNAFSRPMTINVTLFTNNYTKTARPTNFSLTVLISIV